MPVYICVTCGVQYAETPEPPAHCPICEDERQYIGPDGQRWTTLESLQRGHRNEFIGLEAGLTAIATAPKFAIGQRAMLVESPQGNVLWDCISLIDDATVAAVRERGGVAAIAICHPHFYDSLVEWSRALGDVPVYLHSDDRRWVMRPDPAIRFWDGETCALNDEMTLIRCGGHFPGSSVLHWRGGAQGKGALLTGDTITVVADRRYVTFMYSYPNQIPLDGKAVEHIVEAVESFAFDRIYGGWAGSVIGQGAKAAVVRSAERYTRAMAGVYPA
ncbi:MAG: hypothetical protein KF753_07475 [Caldilineaceae bacterium]|nr:hypothetical protein [Caldilineaceae bacterium]